MVTIIFSSEMNIFHKASNNVYAYAHSTWPNNLFSAVTIDLCVKIYDFKNGLYFINKLDHLDICIAHSTVIVNTKFYFKIKIQ